MTDKKTELRERLKHLGFTQEKQMRLYGEEFELISDPITITDDLVFVNAIEKKSGQFRRVRIPLTIVRMSAA